MSETGKFNIFSFTGKMKILHLSWFAFFITFFVWFNFAPLLAIGESLVGVNHGRNQRPC